MPRPAGHHPPMAFRPPIGFSDFKRIREDDMTYVDKTSVVQRVIHTTSAVFLLPRPRRFGKTLNLSTLRYFLEKSPHDLGRYFEGLKVWNDPAARAHFQRYPVVFLSFKDVKYRTWADCLASVGIMIAGAFGEHRYLLDGLSGDQAEAFQAVLERRADLALLGNALRLLSDLLAAHHQERVVLLIDDYDTPIHAGFVSGYYDEVVGFFRNFLSAGLKDNPHLFKGVITGILRISKENLFSGLNNLQVFGLADEPFATDFGFTEEEVVELARAAGAAQHLNIMRQWYNGYRFADAVIYNPWSVLLFLADPRHEPRAHASPTSWATPHRGDASFGRVLTSSNDLLREVLVRGGLDHPNDIETLLAGGSVRRVIEDNIVLRDIHQRPSAVWSLLFHSGYLTGTDGVVVLGGRELTLRVPNREVFDSYHLALSDWLLQAGRLAGLPDLPLAILSGDAGGFADILGDLLLNVPASRPAGATPHWGDACFAPFHDFGTRISERVYHAFLAGLLVATTATHEVRSNRESGRGRYDVALIPRTPGQPGAVMELKVQGRDTVEGALDKAAQQLIDRQYAAEVRARGATPIHGYAVVFDGKVVHIHTVDL